jgi:[NiFe] hydrogenase diaphorase moiety large subunit
MSDNFESVITTICEGFGNDKTRMMDIVREVQETLGCVSDEAMELIAARVNTHRVEVESVVSFYAFLSKEQKGKTVIRLCDDIIDRMAGFEHVKQAFCDALGIGVGESTDDGLFTLETTPCIGMCDQAPAAMINDEVFTDLTRDAAVRMVEQLRIGVKPERLHRRLGDGNNSNPLVSAAVVNNIRKRGEVIFAPLECGTALKKALAMSPNEVIRVMKTARLRGRGGAGFPTGMKWDFTRAAEGEKKYVVCNADEGEPGTFKDRVILTEHPDLLFEGMIIAGYAIGAQQGIIYLRGEYAYLRPFLEDTLQKARNLGMLGSISCGKTGFNFDIRIQMGAGAYICGEETSLISSCEGLCAAIPRTARRSPRRRATWVTRRRSTTSKPSAAWRASSTRVPAGSPRSAPRAAPAPSCSASPATAASGRVRGALRHQLEGRARNGRRRTMPRRCRSAVPADR